MFNSKSALLIPIMFLSSCSVNAPENDLAQEAAAEHKLHSDEPKVKISIPDVGSIDWIIRPDLDIDPLVLQCPQNGQKMTVIFESNLETLSFQVAGDDRVLVDVIVDDVAATTLVECTIPYRNYREGDYSAGRSTADDYEADLSPILDAFIGDDEPGGILTVWERGDLIYSYSRGFKDPVSREPRDIADHFDLASVSKEFTAIAILRMVEEEKLSLETRLDRFLPQLPNAKDITIYHLLTHTHGLPEFTAAEAYDDTQEVKMDSVIKVMAEMEPNFPPGTDYRYGNVSYFLLAKISEKVTGQKHSEYIRENLLKPANMLETYFLSDNIQPFERVSGFYENNDEVSRVEKDRHPSHFTGYGDMVSTFDDLQKWYRSLSEGKIISKKMFELAVTQKSLVNGDPIERGFSFFSDMISDERVIYNSGDYFTHTRYIYFSDQDKFVALNTNNPIEHHDYTASDIYLHVVGKLINREKFIHWSEDVDLTDL